MRGSDFKPFEGMWLASPSGIIACAKVINGKLLIPYTRSEERRLAGRFFDCQLVGQNLFARFERLPKRETGVLLLTVAENFTLKGGWWTEENLPGSAREDITRVKPTLPGMVSAVWVLMPKAKTPAWANHYFLEWSTSEE